MSKPFVFSTDYREGSAKNLVRYLENKEQEQGRDRLRDSSGQPLSDTEKKGLIAASEHYDFERQLTFSPGGDSMDREQLDRAGRNALRDWAEGRPTARYAYAVQTDRENYHVQAVAVGSKSDLRMDREDLAQTRSQATERFQEQEQERERTRNRDRERPEDVDHDRDHEQEHEQDRDRGMSL